MALKLECETSIRRSHKLGVGHETVVRVCVVTVIIKSWKNHVMWESEVFPTEKQSIVFLGLC